MKLGGLVDFCVSFRVAVAEPRSTFTSFKVDGLANIAGHPATAAQKTMSACVTATNITSLFISPLLFAVVAARITADNARREFALVDTGRVVEQLCFAPGREALDISTDVMLRTLTFLQMASTPAQTGAGGNRISLRDRTGATTAPPTELGDTSMGGAETYIMLEGDGLWSAYKFTDNSWYYIHAFRDPLRLAVATDANYNLLTRRAVIGLTG
jgi:hypothetical protein